LGDGPQGTSVAKLARPPVRFSSRAAVLLVPLTLLAGLGAARADRDEDLLVRGDVVERVANQKAGVNASLVLRLTHGNQAGRAIFKPVDGQRPTLLDLLSHLERGSFAAREAAASELAIALGVPYVPRTVVREVGGRRGSLQLWVEDAQRAKDIAAPGRELDRGAAEMLRVFDYLIGNSDRSGKNLMVKERGGRFVPVAIDNGNSFPRAPIPRFRWPHAWVAGQTGPLLPETRAFIDRIDPAEVLAVLERSGIERDAAIHVLRRLTRLKRDPGFLEVPRGRAAGLRMVLRITMAGRSGSQRLPRAERDAIDAQVIERYGPAPARTGIIASTGLHGGIPGTGPNLGIEAGFSWRTDPASGRRKLILYGSGGGSILFWGRKGVSSTLKLEPTIEKKFTAAGLTVARNHPIFGDRVAVSPPLMSIYASRTGGLGLSVDTPPLVSPFGLGFPIVRSEFSFYISHPKLTRVSNRFLDWSDRTEARVKNKLAPTLRKLTQRANRVRGMWRRSSRNRASTAASVRARVSGPPSQRSRVPK